MVGVGAYQDVIGETRGYVLLKESEIREREEEKYRRSIITKKGPKEVE